MSSENEQNNQNPTILGQAPGDLIRYLYFALIALIVISFVSSFLSHPSPATNANLELHTEKMQELQQKMAQGIPTPEMYEELEKLREEMIVNVTYENRGSISLGLVLTIAGLGVFGLCVFLYLAKKNELGEVLTSHAGFLWVVQLACFVLGMIVATLFMSFAPFLLFLFGFLYVAVQIYVVMCGYHLLQRSETVTKDSLLTEAKSLKNIIQNKAKNMKSNQS
ncbi:MAG: hypothetical protein AAF569_04495 [Pseudomonadota bacterium]